MLILLSASQKINIRLSIAQFNNIEHMIKRLRLIGIYKNCGINFKITKEKEMKISLLIRSTFIIALGITSLQTYAIKPFVITCGDGKTIEVADSRYSPNKGTTLCLRAGHPAPKQFKPAKNLSVSPSTGHTAASSCPKYDPDSAILPTGKCKQTKKTIAYDPDCAKLYGCNDTTKKGSRNSLLSKKANGPKMGLLLPAVQKSACGSSSSISAALDQCGKKGHVFAHCTKSSGNWSCTPKKDQSGPNTRSTKLKSNS